MQSPAPRTALRVAGRALRFAGDTLRIFRSKNARFLGAAVAFYTLLSAAPLFLVVIHVLGAVFGRAPAESALWSGLSMWLEPEGVEAAQALVARLEGAHTSTGILGGALVLYGSIRVFRALHRALNLLFGIDADRVERSRPRVVRYARRYGLAAAHTVLVIVLVASMLLAKSAVALLANLGTHPPPKVFWAFDVGLSAGFAFALFFSLYRLLPEAPVTSRDAAVSAIVSTSLFAAGSELVTEYLRRRHLADVYAGAGALVVCVVWVYYSAQVFFLGACAGVAMRAGSESGIGEERPRDGG